MAFTVAEFEDLLRLLDERPDWRERLRASVLGQRWEGVPDRLDRIEAAIEENGRQIAALTERIDLLTARIDALVRVTEVHARRLDRLDGWYGNLDGEMLELKHHQHVGTYFGHWLRRIRELGIDDLPQLDEAEAVGVVSREETGSVESVDLLVEGVPREGGERVILAVEVSTTINLDDVGRANDRASILRRVGYNARGFVSGRRVTAEAQRLADQLNVIVGVRPRRPVPPPDLAEELT